MVPPPSPISTLLAFLLASLPVVGPDSSVDELHTFINVFSVGHLLMAAALLPKVVGEPLQREIVLAVSAKLFLEGGSIRQLL